MANMKTLQVVGFKNSGKTTLITRWIRLLKEKRITVAVIKHHGHPSSLERPAAHTDGVQYIDNGANLSLVAGGGSAQILIKEEPDLKMLMDYVKINEPTVLLIEGFKNADQPKVVLLRESEDWERLKQLTNIEIVLPRERKEGFQYRSDEEVDQWFLQWVEEKLT